MPKSRDLRYSMSRSLVCARSQLEASGLSKAIPRQHLCKHSVHPKAAPGKAPERPTTNTPKNTPPPWTHRTPKVKVLKTQRQTKTRGNKVRNIVGDKVGDEAGDKVGDKVPRFPEPCACMGKSGEVTILPRCTDNTLRHSNPQICG